MLREEHELDEKIHIYIYDISNVVERSSLSSLNLETGSMHTLRNETSLSADLSYLIRPYEVRHKHGPGLSGRLKTMAVNCLTELCSTGIFSCYLLHSQNPGMVSTWFSPREEWLAWYCMDYGVRSPVTNCLSLSGREGRIRDSRIHFGEQNRGWEIPSYYWRELVEKIWIVNQSGDQQNTNTYHLYENFNYRICKSPADSWIFLIDIIIYSLNVDRGKATNRIVEHYGR
jgi:hypothetical protein